VCLTGDGGDELFAGYETYVADTMHHLTRRSPLFVGRGAAAAVRRFLPVSFDRVSFDYKVRQFVSGHALSAGRAHYHWRTIFSRQEQEQLLEADVWRAVAPFDAYAEFQRFEQQVAECHYLNRASYVDLKTWLVDDILVKADRASMAHSLELRAPFLDHRIVEFAAALPPQWKLRGLNKKRVLKLSQRGRVPADVLQRRKQGFNAPVSHWLMSSFKDEFQALTERRQPLPLFNPSFVRRLWDDHQQRRADHGHKLLGLINLQLWIRHVGAVFN
jgi:asparagine synthase (glutamine-hydrolysing)